MSAVNEIVEKLKTLTLMEAAELVKAIEETFGVSAAVAAGPAAGPAAAAEEEKTEFDVTLESVPADKKISVLKVVRELTGLGLGEAKAFVEEAPKVVKNGVAKAEAEEIKKKIEAAGGVVKIS